MLSRFVRTSIAAVSQFSTKTTALATAGERLTNEGSTVSTSTNRTTADGRDTLGRRLLALVYTKRSAVVTIRKWKEEGHVVRKYELNRIIRELRKLKRYKHSLEICEWMRIQDDIKLVPGDYAVHLDLIAKLRGINSAEKFFEDLPDKMRDQATCSALLHTYAQHKETVKAEALMEKMSECGFLKNPLPYNHMISLYISTGQLEKVPDMIKELKKNGSPDVITYNLWLTVCASQNYIETAEKVFLELKKAKVDPDWVTYSTLTSLYIKNSLKEKAEFALREMEKKVSRKVRVAYASLISLHTSLENKNDVHRIWKKMKSTFRKLNDAEYTCMITSLLKLEQIKEAEKLYKEWESASPTKDSRVPNLLIAAYINKNEMEKAEAFHDQMVKKSIVPGYTTWELLTWCYLKKGQTEKVLDCFKNAVGCVKKWNPDEKMLQEVFRIVEEHGNVEGAEQLIITLWSAGHVKTEAYNSLLRTYAKAGKMPLIVAERMKMDNVKLDEETHRLLELTSKMSVGELPNSLSLKIY